MHACQATTVVSNTHQVEHRRDEHDARRRPAPLLRGARAGADELVEKADAQCVVAQVVGGELALHAPHVGCLVPLGEGNYRGDIEDKVRGLRSLRHSTQLPNIATKYALPALQMRTLRPGKSRRLKSRTASLTECRLVRSTSSVCVMAFG